MKSFIEYMKEKENLKEGHYYLRKSSRSEEKRLRIAKEKSSLSSGMPGFVNNDEKLKELLKKTESKRPLRRAEYIKLYGYEAWKNYVNKNDLPEDHKWADK